VKLTVIQFLLVLLFSSISQAATYYVATSGSDSSSCASAQNINTPKRSFMGSAGSLACLRAGDTLYVRGGTYNESISNTNSHQYLASGTSWSSAIRVAVYPGETVTLTSPMGFGFCCGDTPTFQMSYWIFDGFRIDSTVPTVLYNGQQGVDHLRFINMNITANGSTNAIAPGDFSATGANTSGMCLSGGGEALEFVNIEIHHCGAYGIYYWGHDSLFDRVKMHDVYGYGIHLYHETPKDVSNNVIRNSVFYNIRPAIPNGTYPGVGILLSSGSNNMAYNNIIYNSGQGLQEGFGSTNSRILQNTIFNVNFLGIDIRASSSSAIVRNNIFYQAGAGAVQNGGASGLTLSNNLTTDPLFANSGAADFHLRAGSPAIDTGANLSTLGILSDLEGTPRPQGSGYDIGAFEYGDSTGAIVQPTPSPTPAPSTDATAPSVIITSPTNGSTIKRGDLLTITANATDNVSVVRVEFYVDGNLKCTDSTANYSCQTKINGRRGGQHIIEARGYDSSGNIGRNAVAVVTQ
jgi:parallel beta-helix repeat protein